MLRVTFGVGLAMVVGCGPEHNSAAPAVSGNRYEIVLASDSVPADGLSKVPYFAVGIAPDGGPATEALVLNVSPSFAATVTPAVFTLGREGSTGVYVACNALSSPACVGQVELTLALASDPTTPVARTTVDQVQPTGVGTASPCLVGGNILHFDGDSGDYVFSGLQTVTSGSWSADGSASWAEIRLTPSDSSQGLWWTVDLVAADDQASLVTAIYEDGQRYPFQAPGHPGFDVSGDGRGCNTVSGRFQVEEYVFENGSPKSLTATFEHHCDGQPLALRGCVHWSL
jgi:hypothetical protein